MQKFPFHSDPGHGWLEVTPENLKDVGLTRRDFTTCSYVSRTGNLFLEEDCDAGKFLDAYVIKYQEKPCLIEVDHRGDAPCRSMRPNVEGEWSPFG